MQRMECQLTVKHWRFTSKATPRAVPTSVLLVALDELHLLLFALLVPPAMQHQLVRVELSRHTFIAGILCQISCG